MARPPITRANPYTPHRGSLAGNTFTTERRYRDALARLKGFASWDAQRAAAKAPRSAAAFARLRPAERDASRRALDAISKMRTEGLSLTQAAAKSGTTVGAVKKYAAPALEKTPGGRYQATAFDRLYRRMEFLTPNGKVALEVRDSRSASRIAGYWNAVDHYLRTGDDRHLRPYRGKGVTVGKRFYPFVTDLPTLDRLAAAGEVSFEDLYVMAA
jgi:hypothetical protein